MLFSHCLTLVELACFGGNPESFEERAVSLICDEPAQLLEHLLHALVFCGLCPKLPQSWWSKTTECILSQFWRPEAEIKEWARPRFLAAPCGSWHALACGHVPPGSACRVTAPPPLL